MALLNDHGNDLFISPPSLSKTEKYKTNRKKRLDAGKNVGKKEKWKIKGVGKMKLRESWYQKERKNSLQPEFPLYDSTNPNAGWFMD